MNYPVRNTSRTVLLAEDQDLVRRCVRAALQSAGYTILEANDGREALDLCLQYEGPIHLLLTDIVMPVMSGLDLARRAQRLRPGMKVLYISAHPAPDPGDASYLPKPFGAAEVEEKVSALLELPMAA